MTRLQSEYLLPLARTLHILGAFAALVIGVVALVVAGYFLATSSKKASIEPLPPSYVSPASLEVDMSVVDDYLNPPSGLRFVPLKRAITRKIEDDEILGYLDAQTKNGLAKYPDDFVITGGTDAALFNRVKLPNAQTTALTAGPALRQQINQTIAHRVVPKTQTFHLTAVAYDAYRNRSEPTDIQFTLTFGYNESPGELESTPTSQETSPLEELARQLSEIADPDGTPRKFEGYQRALNVPKDCGAEGNAAFINNFRSSFDASKGRLTSSNLEAFYTGLCEAWQNAVSRERSAAQSAQAARSEVVSRNTGRENEVRLKNLAAKATSMVALSVVGGALVAFVAIALVLAFFAIEGHVLEIRRSVEALAEADQSLEDK